MHIDTSADEHLPPGADNPWTTWKALNWLRTQVGWSRVKMFKWEHSEEPETCDCGIGRPNNIYWSAPMMNTACSTQNLSTADDIAIDCARHWDGTILQACDWRKDNNDDDDDEMNVRGDAEQLDDNAGNTIIQ